MAPRSLQNARHDAQRHTGQQKYPKK